MSLFKSTHLLTFYSRPWQPNEHSISILQLDMFGYRESQMHDDGPPWQEFMVGTCTGQWRANVELKQYELLSIVNSEIGNGHFQDVLEWFEFSAARDRFDFVILEVVNEKLAFHLEDKRGFERLRGTKNYIKRYK